MISHGKPSRGRRTTIIATAVAGALTVFCTVAYADDLRRPIWREPLPGTPAYLGSDGAGLPFATVCDKIADFVPFPDGVKNPSCHRLASGTPVVLGHKVDDPHPPLPGSLMPPWEYPLIQVTIPSLHNYEGYTELYHGVSVAVPAGTIVRCQAPGGDTCLFFRTKNFDEGTNADLAAGVTAKVLHYDPALDRLQVRITSGGHAGSTGWMYAMEAASDDGPVVIFYGALVPLKQ